MRLRDAMIGACVEGACIVGAACIAAAILGGSAWRSGGRSEVVAPINLEIWPGRRMTVDARAVVAVVEQGESGRCSVQYGLPGGPIREATVSRPYREVIALWRDACGGRAGGFDR